MEKHIDSGLIGRLQLIRQGLVDFFCLMIIIKVSNNILRVYKNGKF